MNGGRWTVGRLVGWTLLLVLLLSNNPTFQLSAQHFSVGPQIAFGDYKEVSADLHYRGSGIAAKASMSWKKVSADVVLSKLKYTPEGGTATADFDASEVDVRLRYYIAGPVSGELGFINRKTDPEFEAQSVGAAVIGARMAHPLGPGVHMNLNAGLLVGSKFSGGGTTGGLGAVQLGLGFSVDALRGRLQLTGDYDFQRFSRETEDGSGPAPAPIQQSVGRIGLAIAF
ncbi:MAG: hypothetical protein ACM358_14880 [Gemmatimonadota bacterium]